MGVTYTEGARTVTTTDEEGNEVETTETYQIPHLVEDLAQVYESIRNAMGVEVTPNHQANADNIYNLIVYGTPAAIRAAGSPARMCRSSAWTDSVPPLEQAGSRW